MGLFGGKKKAAPARRPTRPTPVKIDEVKSHLAFVLLEEPVLPDPQKVVEAFAYYASPGDELQIQEKEADESDGEDKEISMLSFSGPGGVMIMAVLMPMPIPNGEAEEHVRGSLSSFKGGWQLPEYKAHIMVTMMGLGSGTPVETLSTFTAFIAAITSTTSAVGVYWGNAGATHSRDFLLSIAEEKESVPRMMLWSGISIAQEEDGRVSILSLGMNQLGLPDLLFKPSASAAPGDALMMMYDLLAYSMSFGKPIPAGNTIGRSANERLKVSYVASPIDDTITVMHIDAG